MSQQRIWWLSFKEIKQKDILTLRLESWPFFLPSLCDLVWWDQVCVWWNQACVWWNQVCIKRIKFAFRGIKSAFGGIKCAFDGIKFAFCWIKFAFHGVKFAFCEFKFLSEESSFWKRLWAPSYTVRHGVSYHMYADDSQVYITFKSDDLEDLEIARGTVYSRCNNWMLPNNLKLNQDKSELTVMHAKHRLKPSLESFQVGESTIVPPDSARNIWKYVFSW